MLAAILAGTLMQRVAGMGFAMISAPLLVLLLGPREGVVLVNLGGALTSLLMLTRVWRDVDWRLFPSLSVSAIVAIVPGAYLVVNADHAWLELGIGLLIMGGLTAVLLLRGTVRAHGRGLAVGFGALSGFSSVLAGTGGPAMTVYAVLTRWDQRAMAATLQPLFVTMATASLTGKALAGPATVPDLDPVVWLACLAAGLLGLGVGEVLTRHVDAVAARRVTVAVAYVGSAVNAVRGLAGIL